MTTLRSISPGWHFGTAARSGGMGRFLLSETRYPPDLRTPWHAHEAPAFCLVLSGRYVQRFHGREVVYRPATALFRPAAAEHTDHVSPHGATCFIIEPDPAWLAETGLDQLNRNYALDHTGSRARWLLDHALAEFRNPDAATPLALEGLVLALAAEFARITGPRRSRRCPPWLLRTRDALDAAFTTRVRLAALAAEAGVHPAHLAVAFRDVFGISVGEYVRARRIEVAQLALRDPVPPINEIALTLGFSSQSHFTRVFRERTGLTPLGYRDLHAKA
jgi:AraC family transcriptional regulator